MATGKGAGRKIDLRSKHHHWRVTITYSDQETFGRVYSDREKAEKFAGGQKKSPVAKRTQIEQLD